MDNPNAAIYLCMGFGLVMGVLWIVALIRAYSKIQTNAFFPAERPLPQIEFWRYLFSCTLLCLTGAGVSLIVSRQDIHYPIYRYPVAIERLFVGSLMEGLMVGLCTWLLIRISTVRDAKFHHPNLSTWKELRFWGPKKRKMTAEEKILLLQKMGWSDYLEALRFSMVIFALLPFIFIWPDLMTNGSMEGFAPVLKSFFRELIPVEIFLVGLALILGSVFWLLKRLFLWLGWRRTLC